MAIDFEKIENPYVREAAKKAGAVYFKKVNEHVSFYINKMPDENGKINLPEEALDILLEAHLRNAIRKENTHDKDGV